MCLKIKVHVDQTSVLLESDKCLYTNSIYNEHLHQATLPKTVIIGWKSRRPGILVNIHRQIRQRGFFGFVDLNWIFFSITSPNFFLVYSPFCRSQTASSLTFVFSSPTTLNIGLCTLFFWLPLIHLYYRLTSLGPVLRLALFPPKIKEYRQTPLFQHEVSQ